MTDQDLFVKAFDKDMVGTTYDPESISVHFAEDVFEVLEFHQYVKQTVIGNKGLWIKIKDLPDDFDFLNAKDEYIFAEPDGFLKDFRLAEIGTKFQSEQYRPADISFQIDVLEYGKYIRVLDQNGVWIKVAHLPDDYDFGKEGDAYIIHKEWKKSNPHKLN